ncbi:MAG: heme exporter protein CcmB [Legionellales bacterium]
MLTLLRYQLLLAYRQRSEWVYSVLFFLLVISLFPLAVSPEKPILQILAAGVIWVAALLATLLSATQLFANDFSDGSLEQWLLSPRHTVGLIMLKIFGHWLITGLPLILLAPVAGVILYLPAEQILILWVTLWLGTPSLSLVSAIAVALTVGLRQGGVLLALLVLPLYIPVLIFASSAVLACANNLPVLPHLALLAAFFFFSLTLVPLVTVYALRLGVR